MTRNERILLDALQQIASYGLDSPNRPFVRAFHREIITIARQALNQITPAGWSALAGRIGGQHRQMSFGDLCPGFAEECQHKKTGGSL